MWANLYVLHSIYFWSDNEKQKSSMFSVIICSKKKDEVLQNDVVTGIYQHAGSDICMSNVKLISSLYYYYSYKVRWIRTADNQSNLKLSQHMNLQH